jgi:hypothetical protein
VAENVQEARALYDIVKSKGVRGAAGIVQGERALAQEEVQHADAEHAAASRIAPEETRQ